MINYHLILGVAQNATLDQIKKAYRQKAKQLHPDRNQSEDANEQFILLNEAYEYLLNTSGNHTNSYKRAQEQAKKQAAYQKVWQEQERQRAREKAQEYARMKYEAYIKSDIYKKTEAMNFIADLMGLGVLILFSFILPIMLTVIYGVIGLLFGLLIVSPSMPFWYKYLKQVLKTTKLKDLNTLHTKTIRGKMTNMLIVTSLNIFLIIKIALNTLIELHWIFLLYGIAIILGYIASLKINSRYFKYLIRYGAAPLLINLLFAINFIFSSKPTTESYWYTYEYNKSPGIYKSINLDNNVYNEFAGIRMVFNTELVEEHSRITYEIKNGCLGFKVVKRFTID